MFPLKDNIPTRRFPIVTVAILVANIAVFLLFQQALTGPNGGFDSPGDPDVVVEYTFIPYELSHLDKVCGQDAVVDGERVETEGIPLCEDATQTLPTTTGGEATVQVGEVFDRDQPSVWITIFTSMFMHGSVLHILGNMLFLWIFGNNVEDSMGHVKFTIFYLAGGVAAALAQYALGGPDSPVPMLGASGAIAAVLGGYALLYPRARVLTLVFIIVIITFLRLPALLVLGAWFLLQLLDASSQAAAGGGGVAVWAHIGGFVFGLIAIKLFASDYDPHYDRHERAAIY